MHQEFSLIPGFTATENILLNREPQKKNVISEVFGSRLNTLDYKEMDRSAAAAIEKMGVHIDANMVISDMPVGHKQFTEIARELLETREAHKAGCVGMAANMIGVHKRIIAFDNEGSYMVMFNPEIVKKSGAYETEEGCLSLTGTRKTRRWQSIKVQYLNEKMQIRLKTFTGWT